MLCIRALSAAVLVAAAAGSASGVTVATFADPTSGATPSLFQYNATTQTLTGGYSGLGLTLETPGLVAPDFADVTFTMTPLAAVATLGPFVQFGPGSVQFFDSVASPIFRIDFTGALLAGSQSFGASDFSGFGVTFSGSILGSLQSISNEAFAFSFANPVATQTGFTVTSSFTSSADIIIPSPGAAALLGVGGLLMARRRRSA